MQITAQVRQEWTAVNGNGVLRATPDRAAPIAVRLPDGTKVTTVAEIRTIPGTDGNWRLVEWPDRDVLYMLRLESDWAAGAILPEPVPPPIDCTAAIASATKAGEATGAGAVKQAAIDAAALYGG